MHVCGPCHADACNPFAVEERERERGSAKCNALPGREGGRVELVEVKEWRRRRRKEKGKEEKEGGVSVAVASKIVSHSKSNEEKASHHSQPIILQYKVTFWRLRLGSLLRVCNFTTMK